MRVTRLEDPLAKGFAFFGRPEDQTTSMAAWRLLQ